MKTTDGNAAGSGRDRSTAARARRAGLAMLVVALVTFWHAPAATALTAEEQFLAQLGKVAPLVPAKAKRLCRCTASMPGGADLGVGELRTIIVGTNGVVDYGVTCVVAAFDASTGAVDSTRPCTDHQFEILPK